MAAAVAPVQSGACAELRPGQGGRDDGVGGAGQGQQGQPAGGQRLALVGLAQAAQVVPQGFGPGRARVRRAAGAAPEVIHHGGGVELQARQHALEQPGRHPGG